MSDERERPVKRTIIIEIREGNDFNVKEGDRYCDRLCWDEMLGAIAELTHPSVGQARFRMLTAEEWADEERRRGQRRNAINSAIGPEGGERD